jgi:hypothetical protein
MAKETYLLPDVHLFDPGRQIDARGDLLIAGGVIVDWTGARA